MLLVATFLKGYKLYGLFAPIIAAIKFIDT